MAVVAEEKLYELGYLLTPLVAPETVAETVETEIKHWLALASAVIEREISPRLRTLAYPIKKIVEHKGSIFRDAYFGSIVFKAGPEAIATLEAELKKSSAIIRHLLIILPTGIFAASARPQSPASMTIPPDALSTKAAETAGEKMTTAAIDEEINQLLATPK